jgi:hypothetical protein
MFRPCEWAIITWWWPIHRTETCSCILHIVTIWHIVVFRLYVYVDMYTIYTLNYWPNTTGKTHLKINIQCLLKIFGRATVEIFECIYVKHVLLPLDTSDFPIATHFYPFPYVSIIPKGQTKSGQLNYTFVSKFFYSPTNAQVTVLKTILKFTLKYFRNVSLQSHHPQGAHYLYKHR